MKSSRYHLYENDPADFKMPYSTYGKLEREVMFVKYERLEKITIGVIIRPGLKPHGS